MIIHICPSKLVLIYISHVSFTQCPNRHHPSASSGIILYHQLLITSQLVIIDGKVVGVLPWLSRGSKKPVSSRMAEQLLWQSDEIKTYITCTFRHCWRVIVYQIYSLTYLPIDGILPVKNSKGQQPQTSKLRRPINAFMNLPPVPLKDAVSF